MFELEGSPGAMADDRHAAALARLKRVLPHPPRPAFGPVERARKIGPGVYRSAGRRPIQPGFTAPKSSPARSTGDTPSTARPSLPMTVTSIAASRPAPTIAAVLAALDTAALSSYDLVECTAGWERLISWAQANQAEAIAQFARRRPGPYAPDEPGRSVSEFAADEIAARLRITRRAAELKLGIALDLADRLPATRQALLDGRIDLSKARAIAEHTANLTDPESRRTVEERVLSRAGSQTTSELRRSLLRAVAAVDAQAVVKRHAKATAKRFLSKHLLPDGMAELTAVLPADDAMVVYTAADALARNADPDDPRPIDARRVDALVDLCRPTLEHNEPAGRELGLERDGGPTGRSAPGTNGQAAGPTSTDRHPDDHVRGGPTGATGEPAPDHVADDATGDTGGQATSDNGEQAFRRTAGRSCAHTHGPAVDDRPSRRHRRRKRSRLLGRRGPHIQVTVAATTLLGLDDQPGELAGYGPIPAEMARRIAADPDSTWRRILTDPVSGVLLDYGTTVYRPPPGLARHVIARDQVCCFPGCRQPAEYCDLDHRDRYPDGTTSEDNLGPLCRHHHRAKTEGGWTWQRSPDGYIIWTAPTGHTYGAPTPPVLETCDVTNVTDDRSSVDSPSADHTPAIDEPPF